MPCSENGDVVTSASTGGVWYGPNVVQAWRPEETGGTSQALVPTLFKVTVPFFQTAFLCTDHNPPVDRTKSLFLVQESRTFLRAATLRAEAFSRSPERFFRFLTRHIEGSS